MKTEGIIIEAMGGINYKVRNASGEYRCYLGGKMRVNKISVYVGDRVEIFMPGQGDVGRIVRRINAQKDD